MTLRDSRALLAVAAGAAIWIATADGSARQAPAAAPSQPPAPTCGGRSSQPQSVCPGDVEAMMAALPDKAPARPAHPRKILVLAATSGWVHSSIPIAAKTMEELGKKTGAWTATVSYDRAVITAENLKQYDAVFLDSTTGTYLDEPNAATDPAARTVTDARRKALLDFIRGGKGIAGIHAASDSYHSADPGGGAPLWPEYNKMIGGYFKHHWNYPTTITVKIDDPKSPINAPFKGQPFEIADEVYTYNQDSFSRENVHVLTSIDYSKMSPEVRAKEQFPRTDHDFALSWIRREGKGRLFYAALGHHESIYAKRPMLEHILAGVQYALGDLKADDSPGVKTGTK
jgi:type 1 glutamine amidotransferase